METVVKKGGWKQKSGKNFSHEYQNVASFFFTIAYGVNIFGEDSNSSTTIGQGLTVANDVILV
jgi:hypothetical protein